MKKKLNSPKKGGVHEKEPTFPKKGFHENETNFS